MNNVVIIDSIRTPMGRSKGGVFRYTRAETLCAHLMHHLCLRNPQMNLFEVDDIYWGCVQQTLEQGFNIARNAALLAGFPHSIPATTVNRLCGSSMQALHDGARAIMANDADICIIGGVEHMGHLPMTHGVDFHPGLSRHIAKASGVMGLTAEFIAKRHQVSRETQDEFATRSHQKAHQASINDQFKNEIIPILGQDAKGTPIKVEVDEVIRPETNLEKLAALTPAFDPKGTITAGNSSAISDGASALLIMSETKAKALNLPYRYKIKTMAVTGCDPALMGLGPIDASKKALLKAGINIKDIDVFEFNEAFAAQVLACIRTLGIEDFLDDKINLRGGAIALGHPLGCSGARICTSLLRVMEQKNARLGLASMCIGLGQGIATLFEEV